MKATLLMLIASMITTVTFYDVPLTNEQQNVVFQVCDKYEVPYEIALAVMEKESTYNTECVGDSGRSLGIMQIQPRWNGERMEQLDCMDLLDFESNITVGISLLSEYIDKYGIEQGLVCYNMGEPRGSKYKSTDYSQAVLEIAERIENDIREVCYLYPSDEDIQKLVGMQLPDGYPYRATVSGWR